MAWHRAGAIVATIILAVAVTAEASAATSRTWTQGRASADRRAWLRDETSISATNVAQLKPLWGWGVKLGYVVTEPLVVDNRLYTVTPDGAVAAVDTSTGVVVKRTAPETASIYTQLATAGSLLYFTEPGPALGTRCGLYAFDRWTLQPRWATPTAALGVACSLAVDGNLAVVAWSQHADPLRAAERRLTFLDATTGKVKGTVNYEAAGDFVAPPTLRNGIVYVVDPAGVVAGVPSAGRVHTFTVNGPLPSWTGGYLSGSNQPLVTTPEAVYTLGFDGLRAFNPTTGALLWAQLPPAGKEWITEVAMAVDGERVYLEYQPSASPMGPYDQPVLAAVNRLRGGFVWSTHIERNRLSPPVVANGLVYTAAGENLMTARKGTTGKVVWEEAPVLGVTPADITYTLTFAGGRLYARIAPAQVTPFFWFVVAYGRT